MQHITGKVSWCLRHNKRLIPDCNIHPAVIR